MFRGDKSREGKEHLQLGEVVQWSQHFLIKFKEATHYSEVEDHKKGPTWECAYHYCTQSWGPADHRRETDLDYILKGLNLKTSKQKHKTRQKAKWQYNCNSTFWSLGSREQAAKPDSLSAVFGGHTIQDKNWQQPTCLEKRRDFSKRQSRNPNAQRFRFLVWKENDDTDLEGWLLLMLWVKVYLPRKVWRSPSPAFRIWPDLETEFCGYHREVSIFILCDCLP